MQPSAAAQQKQSRCYQDYLCLLNLYFVTVYDLSVLQFVSFSSPFIHPFPYYVKRVVCGEKGDAITQSRVEVGG